MLQSLESPPALVVVVEYRVNQHGRYARVRRAASGTADLPLSDDSAELDEEAQREAQELAEDGAAAARAGGLDAAARGVLCHGNTWATLVRLAEDERPAAIVVGSRGRSAVKSALLGSVSSGVAHHSSVPVMIVPSPAGEREILEHIADGRSAPQIADH